MTEPDPMQVGAEMAKFVDHIAMAIHQWCVTQDEDVKIQILEAFENLSPEVIVIGFGYLFAGMADHVSKLMGVSDTDALALLTRGGSDAFADSMGKCVLKRLGED